MNIEKAISDCISNLEQTLSNQLLLKECIEKGNYSMSNMWYIYKNMVVHADDMSDLRLYVDTKFICRMNLNK